MTPTQLLQSAQLMIQLKVGVREAATLFAIAALSEAHIFELVEMLSQQSPDVTQRVKILRRKGLVDILESRGVWPKYKLSVRAKEVLGL